MPKKSDEFVKILDLQQFAKRQKKIAADNLNAMRVDQSSDLKRPYFNPGVVGLVNKSNNSYITSLLQRHKIETKLQEDLESLPDWSMCGSAEKEAAQH